jgi:hypothetical protein
MVETDNVDPKKTLLFRFIAVNVDVLIVLFAVNVETDSVDPKKTLA